jgi:hypothetical protein
MLSEAKHLCADRERPFATAQGDTEGKHLRGSTVKLERSSSFEPCLNYVMLTAEHLARCGSPGEGKPRHYISGTSRMFDERLPVVILC